MDTITKDLELRAAAWAAKYKCHTCGNGLPMSRRRHCLECKLELDADPTALELFGEPEEESAPRARTPIGIVSSEQFLCTRCNQTLPVSQCVPKREGLSRTRFSMCRGCKSAANKAYEARKKAQRTAKAILASIAEAA